MLAASPKRRALDNTMEHIDMTTTTTESTVRNGVDTAALFATLDAVESNTEMAQFQFRATNTWVSGTHNRSTIHGFFGAMQEMEHTRAHTIDADHPAVLVGADNGPTPVEHLLHALAACLTAGIANVAAARKVTLTEVTSTVQGNIDLRGMLGIDDGIRNGFEDVTVRFMLKGDDPEKLRRLVARSAARSAVFDVIANGVPVSIDVEAD
ncbi:MAG: OsmC family peroxiredoxin [Ilumatobacteraceae bacterium]|nr:OsmC family peroxiredoxin [Ilumatobacteraceae bacterium]